MKDVISSGQSSDHYCFASKFNLLFLLLCLFLTRSFTVYGCETRNSTLDEAGLGVYGYALYPGTMEVEILLGTREIPYSGLLGFDVSIQLKDVIITAGTVAELVPYESWACMDNNYQLEIVTLPEFNCIHVHFERNQCSSQQGGGTALRLRIKGLQITEDPSPEAISLGGLVISDVVDFIFAPGLHQNGVLVDLDPIIPYSRPTGSTMLLTIAQGEAAESEENLIVANDSDTEIQELPFQAFPNPAHTLLHIVLSSSKNGHLQLFNIQGAVVYESKNTSQSILYIDFTGFSPGVYWLKYKVEGQSAHFQKVLIR